MACFKDTEVNLRKSKANHVGSRQMLGARGGALPPSCRSPFSPRSPTCLPLLYSSASGPLALNMEPSSLLSDER